MNILVVNDGGLAGGGAEIRTLSLLDYWYQQKQISVVYLLHRSGLKKLVNRPYIRAQAAESKKDYSRLIMQIARSEPIDLIQVHNVINSGPQFFKVAKEVNLPLVWMAHDFWPICGANYLYNHLGERCSGPSLMGCSRCVGVRSTVRVHRFQKYFKEVDLAITPGAGIQNQLRSNGIQPRNWQVVEPWIDVDLFKPASVMKQQAESGKFKLCYIGPLSRAKGADLALQAFARVLLTFPHAELWMIGGEDYHGTWAKQLATELGIQEKVRWVSRIPQVELVTYLQKSDVLLFTSRCVESFGQVWAQAMAVGCPVVAVETPAIRDLVPEGLIAMSRLSAEHLADRAVALLSSAERCRKVSKESIQFAQQCFNIKRAADKIFKLYKDLIVRSYAEA